MANITGDNSSETLPGTNDDDVIRGLGGNDIIDGLAGNDEIFGGFGVNQLTGGSGNDIFGIEDRGTQTQQVLDFTQGQDLFDVSFFNVGDFATLQPYMRQVGNDVYIETFWSDPNGSSPNEVIILENISLNDLTASDFVFNASITSVVTTVTSFNDFVLFGGSGDDTLTAANGDDELNGGIGNDILTGGFGSNLLRGGFGDDTFVMAARGTQTQTIEDFTQGDDVVDVSVLGVSDLATLQPYMRQVGNDVYIETFWSDPNGLSPNERIIIEDVSLNNLTVADFTFNTSVTDLETTVTSFNDFVLFGGLGNDELTAANGDDQLNGGIGNDILTGGFGSNLLRGGAGNDSFVIAARGTQTQTIEDFTQGEDVIDVRALNVSEFETLLPYMRQVGDDVYIETFFSDPNGLSPNELIIIEDVSLNNLTSADFTFNLINADLETTVTSFNDFVLFGGLGNDELTTANGDDQLNGGVGNDVLSGGFGVNLLRGGDGDDIFAITARGTQTQNVEDFVIGEDRVDVRAYNVDSLSSLMPYLSQVGDDVHITTYFNDINGSSPNEVTIIKNVQLGDLSTSDFLFYDVNADLDINITSSRDHVVFGGIGSDEISTGGGQDQLNGGSGDDTLSAGGDNDILRGGLGADELDGGSGFDIASYEGATAGVFASLFEGLGRTGEAAGDTYIDIEALTGSSFNDILVGRDGVADTLRGGDGSDALRGNGGDDILFGDGGDDLFFSGFGADAHDGGTGIDTVLYNQAGAGVIVNLTSGTGAIGQAAGDTYTSIENVVGTAFADLIVGNGFGNSLQGRAGNDTLDGRGGADLLNGGNGFDVVTYASSFAPVLASLFTGTGSGGHAAGDTYVDIEGLTGSQFNDLLIGRDVASDTLRGGEGSDALRGNGGADFMYGDGGADLFFSGFGSDFHDGGDGVDTILYTQANAGVIVNLTTGSGAFGQAAGDTYTSVENVVGTAFGDLIVGDAVANNLQGRAGNDVLDGRGGSDVLIGGNNADRFVFGEGYGTDRVQDFSSADNDVIDLRDFGFTSFAEVQAIMFTSGADTVINFGGGDALRLVGVDMNTLTASDFRLTNNTSAKPSDAEIETSAILEDFDQDIFSVEDPFAEFLADAALLSDVININDSGLGEYITPDDVDYDAFDFAF